VKEDIIDRLGKGGRLEDCRVSGLLELGTGADGQNASVLAAAHRQRSAFLFAVFTRIKTPAPS
jgi:hypothetical protein